jgi:hypothetical protein
MDTQKRAFLPPLMQVVKGQIKILIIVGSVVIHNLAFAEPGDARKIALEDGLELRIEEILDSRILPHAYYDQAISSIPGIYPESKIIAKRRLFWLGKGDSASTNSIICYKKDSKKEKVTISGVSTSKGKAWHFETETKESLFAETLISVIEALSKIPYDKSLRESSMRQTP